MLEEIFIQNIGGAKEGPVNLTTQVHTLAWKPDGSVLLGGGQILMKAFKPDLEEIQ